MDDAAPRSGHFRFFDDKRGEMKGVVRPSRALIELRAEKTNKQVKTCDGYVDDMLVYSTHSADETGALPNDSYRVHGPFGPET
ncbi:hypothetical protein MRX96_015691 [Rhipicephalus microplus]